MPGIEIMRFSSLSMERELENNTNSVIPFFSLNLGVMIAFCIITCMMTDWVKSKPVLGKNFLDPTKYPRFLILGWEKEYLQTKGLLNATSHFLISHIVGHLLEFIKISLGPPILKIDNFT